MLGRGIGHALESGLRVQRGLKIELAQVPARLPPGLRRAREEGQCDEVLLWLQMTGVHRVRSVGLQEALRRLQERPEGVL